MEEEVCGCESVRVRAYFDAHTHVCTDVGVVAVPAAVAEGVYNTLYNTLSNTRGNKLD